MAENEKLIEEIELKLKTNFAEQMRSNITAFTSLEKKTSTLAKTVTASFDTLSKQILGNIGSLTEKTSKKIETSVNYARGAMKQLQLQGQGVHSVYGKALKQLEQYEKQLGDLKDVFSIGVKSSMANKGISVKEREKDLKELTALYDADIEKINGKIKNTTVKAFNEINKRLGSMAKNTTKSIAQMADSSLTSMDMTADRVIAKIKQAKNQAGLLSGSQKVSHQLIAFKEAENQMKSFEGAFKQHQKMTLDSEKALQQAKLALHNQTNAKMIPMNRQYFIEAWDNNNKIIQSYVAMQSKIENVRKTIDTLKKEISSQATKLAKGIKLEADANKFKRQYTAILKNFEESAKLSGKSAASALYASIEKGVSLKKALAGNIDKLKEMRKSAIALHSTGLVNTEKEVKKLDILISNYAKFEKKLRDMHKATNLINFNQLSKSINPVLTQIKTMRNTILKLGEGIPKLDLFSKTDDVLNAKKQLDQISQHEKKYAKERLKILKHIGKLEEQAHKVSVEMQGSRNAHVEKILEGHHKRLLQRVSAFKKIYDKSLMPNYAGIRDDLEGEAARIQNRLRGTFRFSDYIDSEFKKVKGQFGAIGDQIDKLRNKRFVDKSSFEALEKAIEAAKNKTLRYESALELVKKRMTEIKRLQKAGLLNIDVDKSINQLKEQEKRIKQNINSLNSLAVQASRRVEAVHNQSTKSMFRTGWEALRNFRWQVAAFYYLVTKAVMAIKTTFTDVINEAQQFRMNAFSLASSIAYNAVEGMETAFESAYVFARGLLEKMEVVAARTILTFEDMTTLVKTFAQAGFIPTTDEDLQKVATIGTAIKTLTEGMANAGVQMKQELMAVIQGRQRATDQLAMMLRLTQGINITDAIKKGQEEGRRMIDILADALAPYQKMNEVLTEEYITQLNTLKTIWGRLKRIAAEPVLKMMAEGIKVINEQLGVFVDEKLVGLTDKAKNIIAGIQAGLTIIVGVGKAVFSIFVELLAPVGSLLSLFSSTSVATSNSISELYKMNSAVANVAESMRGLLYITVTVSETIKVTARTLKLVAEALFTVSKLGIAKHLLAQGKVIKASEVMHMHIDDLKKGWDSVVGSVGEADDAYADIDKKVKAIITNIENLNKKVAETPELTTQLIDLSAYSNEIAKLKSTMKESELAALSGAEKITATFKQKADGYAYLEKAVKANINSIVDDLTRMDSGGAFIISDEKIIEKLQEKKGAAEEILDSLEKFRKTNAKAEKNALNKHYKTVQDHLIAVKHEYDNLYEKLDDQPKRNPWQKVNENIGDLERKFAQFFEKNKNAAKQLGLSFVEITDAIDAKRVRDLKIIDEKSLLEFEKFVESLTSHRILNEYEKIDNEINKQIIAFEKTNRLLPEQKAILKGITGIIKEERKEIVRTAQAYKVLQMQMENHAAIAGLMMDSENSAERQRGEILAIQIERRRAYADTYKEISDIMAANVNQLTGEWKKGTKAEQEYVSELIFGLEFAEKALDRHLWEVQHPFWAELIDMAEGWKDSIVDAFTEALWEGESFRDAMRNIIQDISKDITQAFIKRAVVDKSVDFLMGVKDSGIFGMLGSGEDGGGSAGGFMQEVKNIFGKEPMPVYIVNDGLPGLDKVTNDVGKNLNKTAGIINGVADTNSANMGQEIKNNTGVFEDGFDTNTKETKKGFGSLFKGICNLGSTIVSALGSFFSNIGSGIGSVASSVVGLVTSVFGGSSAGTINDVVGAASSGFLSGIMDYGGFSGGGIMQAAHGGVIEEPIIGRGLRSGSAYSFGEKTKYGENELIKPMKKESGAFGNNSVAVSVPINISGMDTNTRLLSQLREEVEQTVIDVIRRHV